MKSHYSKYLVTFIIFCVSLPTLAQDSLSLYQNIENQLNQFRILNSDFYYNPAHMSDYSTFSFSNIRLNRQRQNKEAYILQEGKEYNEVSLEASSYKATQKNLSIWGEASYTSRKTKNVQWNNNIDLDRTNPIVIADSIGGTMNLQTYNFKGGFAKNIQKFTLGTELKYEADLNYKTQDPRPKNTTSDLSLIFGTAYNINSKYAIGLAAGINRYIQTTTVAFSSEVQRTALYQMNGLGTYNFYFSNKSENAVFTDFVHNYLFTFGTKDQLFNIAVGTSYSNLKKDISLSKNSSASSNNSGYETNRIDSQQTFASITKIVPINMYYKIGSKISYIKNKKTGTEIFYTNNTDIVSKLLENESYSSLYTNYDINLIFQYQKNGTTLYIQPFYKKTKTNETKLDIASQQNFDYDFIGTKLFYLQQLNSKNVISIYVTYYKRALKNLPDELVLTQHQGINEWLISDNQIKQLDYHKFETAIRYDSKFLTKQSVYAIFAVDYHTFSNKTNNIQTTLSLGITF